MSADKKIFQDQTIVFTGKLASMSRKEARELVKIHGGTPTETLNSATSFLIVGDEGFLTKQSKSRKLEKAEKLNENDSSIQIISESAFLEMLGLESRYQLENKYYALSDILGMYKSIRRDQIRYCQRMELLKPVVTTNVEQYFEFKDLLLFRKINQYLEQGKTIRTIVRGLRSQLFPSKQLKIQFEEDQPKGKILELPQQPASPAHLSADEWYELGDRHDTDQGDRDEAIAAYQRTLEIDPKYFPAAVNLGNIYFEQGQYESAKQLYLKALEIVPDSHKIMFNLGNLHDEIGEYELALTWFKKAINEFPLYADAHFNIAVVYEKIGLIEKAKIHWQKYLKIDNSGEWAEIAREHLAE